MNRTILSLALLKAHWEKEKKDYIDNFVPFLATIIKEKNYLEIDLDTLQDDFKERFGLIIPNYALITILNRARKKFLYRKYGKIFVNQEKISSYDTSFKSSEIERKFNNITHKIIEFGKKEFNFDISKEEVEEALLSFLKEHDLDILFASKNISILPNVNPNKKVKYIISRFILFVYNNDVTLFNFLLDITVGHALSSAILYSDFNYAFSGKLKNLNIYIDTPLILDLLGLNGSYNQQSIIELIKILNEEKANLYILETTKGEVNSILQDAINHLEKGNVDIKRSSKILRFCVKNGISSSDLQSIFLTMDKTLDDYDIIPSAVPSYEDHEILIDEVELEKTIKDTYKKIIDNFDEKKADIKGTIQRDVKVLSGIYRFRKGHKPKTIKDSKAIFITSNSSLALASRVFETKHNGDYFTIPSCLTSVFLGTTIWLQSPQKVIQINTKKFIADCYSSIQPSSSLINKYIEEIEKLKDIKRINNDEYYLLRTHQAALNLLETKTLGDPDAIDTRTVQEILDGIISKKIKERLINKSKKIALVLWKAIFFIIIIFIVFSSVFDFFQIENKFLKYLIIITLKILTILGIVIGFNIKVIKNPVLKWLEKIIYNFLK